MSVNKIKSHWNERWSKVKAKADTKKCNYLFSDYGRLKSVDKMSGNEKLLRGSLMKQGFMQLNLKLEDGVRQGFYVHQLVASKFIKKDKSKPMLIHIDGNKLNNYWENLQRVDRAGMTQHQIAQGVYLHENRKMPSHAKMNETKVRLLKKRLQEGKTKRKVLAKSFGITETQVRRIEKGENWGHVTLDEPKKAKAAVKAKPVAKAKAAVKAKVKPVAKAKAKVKPVAKAKAAVKAKPVVKAKAAVKAKAKPVAKAKAAVKAKAKAKKKK
jgi:hypothetical protein